MDTLQLNTLAALLYSALVLLSALSVNPYIRYWLPTGAIWLSLSFSSGVEFAILASIYIGITYLLRRPQRLSRWIKYPVWLMWIMLTIGLITHLLPGYEGLRLTYIEPVKDNSLATSVYLNTDKVLIAWSLLQWLPVWQQRPGLRLSLPAWVALGLALATIPMIMLLAYALGLVLWQPQASLLLGIIVISNLLNTCFTEELLFRGAVQGWLTARIGNIQGLLIASGLFGLAHFAGGYWYALLATLAGLLYGLVFLITGRLWWAIVCHWSFNSVHILLLTWPMRQPG